MKPSILGNSINNKATTFYLGDNALDQQFRAILDFTTSSLPDNAVIVNATLKIKKLSVTGTDPFTTHQIILCDIKNGSFGAVSLQATDFQAPASLEAAGSILNAPVDNWYSSALDESVLQYINKTGSTQFRLRFRLDDNDDMGADTIKFSSGDSTVIDFRPILQVEYYIP